MKLVRLLLFFVIVIVCYFVIDFIININKPIKIAYIKALEYKQIFNKNTPEDIIGEKVFVEDILKKKYYFYNPEGQKIYMRNYPYEQSLIKQEFYVVKNYRWKSQEEIREKIVLFNRKTISLDSIRKYSAGYSRFFLLEKANISENYQYSENGDFVGSLDYEKTIEIIYKWKICIKESDDIFEGKIGDSILVNKDLEFCNLQDVQKVDSLLKNM